MQTAHVIKWLKFLMMAVTIIFSAIYLFSVIYTNYINTPKVTKVEDVARKFVDKQRVTFQNDKKTPLTLCHEIKAKYENRSLFEYSVLPDLNKMGLNKSFYIDIDNDGKNEELQYSPANRVVYFSEIVDGKRIGITTTSIATASVTAIEVIKIRDINYILFLSENGPFELQRAFEMNIDDFHEEIPMKLRDKIFKSQKYKIEVLCKYYT